MNILETDTYCMFHDESECYESDFLYHGFLFINNKYGRDLLTLLTSIKNQYNYRNKEIHFYEITQHSESPYGTKTKVAIEWLKIADLYLKTGKLKYYCFGINKRNLNNFWSNNNTFDKNVYLRFFQIGIKSSIRWFNLPKVTHFFLDSGPYESEKQFRIKTLNYQFIWNNLNNKIDVECIKNLSSDEMESNHEFSNYIQLTDILTGIVRHSFVKTNPKHKGKFQCLDLFIDLIERFNNKNTAYNVNYEYYKNFNINFYPTKNSLTKDEFFSNDIIKYTKSGSFYCDRYTHRQLIQNEYKKSVELTLFDNAKK